MERPIGKRFVYKSASGEICLLRVVLCDGPSCAGCHFHPNCVHSGDIKAKYLGGCSAGERKDSKYIHFKLIKSKFPYKHLK